MGMLLPQRCPGCYQHLLGPCSVCVGHLSALRSQNPDRAALVHAGQARRMVLWLKYRNARHVAAQLAVPMAHSVRDPGELDVVTWAPTSARRIADRGFDPAELLARAVADLLGLPCRRLLHRARRSGPQSGKSRVARLAGPEFVGKPLWRAPRVLLIDDVTTTGATLRAGAAALLRVGAAEVRCLAATEAPSSR